MTNLLANANHQISPLDTIFLRAFEACEIPLDSFHHKEHILLAYILLVQNDLDTAYLNLKRMLQHYLEHNTVPPEKYHVTMTLAWLMAVLHFMHKSADSDSSEDFISQNDILLDTEIMFSHYSRELLLSAEARMTFVEPDLERIPIHTS